MLLKATIHRVEQGSACSSGCGGGWGNLAFPDLQDALDVAVPGDEIWVATGAYYPSKDVNGNPAGGKEAVFYVIKDVKLYGGYPAGGGTRDWDANPTVLSGNIGNPGQVADNSFNVTWLAPGGGHVVDGFIIQDGNFDNTFTGTNVGGAGLVIRDGAATIRNCTFQYNEVSYDIGGGGISSWHSDVEIDNCIFRYNKTLASGLPGGAIRATDGNTLVSNCTFENNSAISNGGAFGGIGGIHSIVNSTFKNNASWGGGAVSCHGNPASLSIEDCYFEGNSAVAGGAVSTFTEGILEINSSLFIDNFASRDGGAIRADHATTITGCYFENNQARRGGGGYFAPGGVGADIINCIFHRNTAQTQGGAAYFYGDIEVINSICHENQAKNGGGVYNQGDPNSKGIYNSIFWDNVATASGDDIFDAGGAVVTVKHCLLQVYAGGGSNLVGFDPLFVNAANPYGPDQLIRTADDGLFVQSASPALDFGDNNPVIAHGVTGDFNGNPRIAPTVVDAGAYEGSATCLVDSILYVDKNANGANTGACWSDALKELRDAIALIPSYPNVTTIKVAQGTYLPTSNMLDRTASFVLPDGIAILGGYPTGGGIRDFNSHICILSGDIGTGGVQSDNSYHVLKASNVSENTLLDGFTVMLGKTDNTQPVGGAGMYLYKSDIALKNCRFQQNIADNNGGAIQSDQSSPLITNCHFSGNSAATYGGAFFSSTAFYGSFSDCSFNENAAKFGGALTINSLAKGLVSNCSFTNNSANMRGGAVYLYNRSFPNFEECLFTGNTADQYGGAIYSRQLGPEHKRFDVYLCAFEGNSSGTAGGAIYNTEFSSPRILNSVFYNNSSNSYGGAIGCTDTSHSEIVNSTFFANEADTDGGALYNSTGSKPIVRNSIMYDNTSAGVPDIQNVTGASTAMIYSLSQTFGTTGVNGNIVGADPMFFDQSMPSGADGLWGNSDDGLHLQSVSDCIDKGATVYIPNGVVGDMAGSTRVQGATIDMGAYESPYGEETPPIFPEDLNNIQAFQGCEMDLPEVVMDVVNDFGAVPDDGLDDTPAFVEASYWLRTNSNPSQRLVLNIPSGEYNIGIQVDYLDTWVSGSVSYANNTYVKMGIPIFDLYDAQNITIRGEGGAVMKFNDDMYFGGYDISLNPVNQTFATPAPRAASVGIMFLVKDCDCVSVSGLELHGNDDQMQLGGHYNDGYQLGYDGVVIIGSTNIEVSNVYSHNHGRDGIMVHRQEPTTAMPQDIFMYNSRFVQNGRQGLSWTAGDTIRALSCSFNESAMGAIQNRLGAGIDIEPENGICINGYFKDCEMIGSRFSQIHADRAVNPGWQVGNVHFDNCFVWAKNVSSSAWGIWCMRMRNTMFTDCKVYGSILHVGGTGPLDYLKFENCFFSDEGPDGEAVYYASKTILNMASGPGFNGSIDNLNYDYCDNVFHQFTGNVFELHHTATAQNVLFTEFGTSNTDNYPAFRTYECNEFRYFTNDLIANFAPYSPSICPNSLGLYGGYFFNSNLFSNRFLDMNPVDPGGPGLPNIPWTCTTSYYISADLNHNNTNENNTILPKSIIGARHSRVSRRPNPLNSWNRNYNDF